MPRCGVRVARGGKCLQLGMNCLLRDEIVIGVPYLTYLLVMSPHPVVLLLDSSFLPFNLSGKHQDLKKKSYYFFPQIITILKQHHLTNLYKNRKLPKVASSNNPIYTTTTTLPFHTRAPPKQPASTSPTKTTSTKTMSSSAQHQQSNSNTIHTTFGGPDADLAARLQAPVSPTSTTCPAANEARRRTSEWKPSLPGRTLSFDHEEHKHAMMMSGSGALALGAGGAGDAGSEGFTERA